jgi:hypothetical protein
MSKIQWIQPITMCTTLLCLAIYCIQQSTVSKLVFNIHLFNFPLSTCCSRIVLRSAKPFMQFSIEILCVSPTLYRLNLDIFNQKNQETKFTSQDYFTRISWFIWKLNINILNDIKTTRCPDLPLTTEIKITIQM